MNHQLITDKLKKKEKKKRSVGIDLVHPRK